LWSGKITGEGVNSQTLLPEKNLKVQKKLNLKFMNYSGYIYNYD